MSTWSTLYLLDAHSPIMEQMTFFHDHTMTILIMITSLVGYLLLSILFSSFSHRKIMESQNIEIMWTFVPMFTLIFIAFPSLQILYLTDESLSPSITIKSMGHQWYWSYEFTDFNSPEYDSYMEEYKINNTRLLNTDNHMVIPTNTQTRIIVSATDVIHSWTIPSISIKLDAIPGRLNQSSFFVKKISILFGQCSEICGSNHSFMPIVMESIPQNQFINWVNNL